MPRNMIKPMAATALAIMAVAGCSSGPPKREGAPPFRVDPPVGTVLRRYAMQRSVQECKVNALDDQQCKMSIDDAQRHLDDVDARLEALLKDPKTNLCDLVRWVGSCANPIYTLGDLADCLQVAPDRGEALNSGRFVLALDPYGCPTNSK